MRRFIVIGQTATASGDFSLDDLPSSSGRLDILLRCLRSSLLISHGLRRDVVAYLVLEGGPLAPRVLRVDGAAAKFIRPDERALALLVKRALAAEPPLAGRGFLEVKPGLAVANGGLDCAVADLGGATPYVLEERAPDLRAAGIRGGDTAFFIGDQLGFAPATRAALADIGACPVSVGPVSLHSDDVVVLISNELDRHEADPGWNAE